MFILKSKTQLEKAIAKAKKVRCAVKFRSFGNYSVKGTTGFYTVICRKDAHGNRIVECECKGGSRGLPCYHAVSALSLHIALARQRQAAIV